MTTLAGHLWTAHFTRGTPLVVVNSVLLATVNPAPATRPATGTMDLHLASLVTTSPVHDEVADEAATPYTVPVPHPIASPPLSGPRR